MKSIGRKRKSGFTLVELIVVIAIMAVLAGTVAGATVSTLNKQRDKAQFTFQCKAIAVKVASWAQEYDSNYAGFAKEVMGLSDAEVVRFLLSANNLSDLGDYGGRAYDALKNEFSSLDWQESSGVPEKKGTFGATIVNRTVYIMYRGKSNNYAEVGYTVTMEGKINPFDNGFPE